MSGILSISSDTAWFELFSRGARDWLRHNQKVREAVQHNISDLLTGPDLITGTQDRTVQVPVRLLEHARFRLADVRGPASAAAGQGHGKPGDLLRPLPRRGGDDDADGAEQEGEIRLLLEFRLDDIVDWIWEEMRLPWLQPRRNAGITDADLIREGWDKRGALSRLDRRRTVKEAVKRRAIQPDAPPFSNEDLRFRQLVLRRKPVTSAVVLFVLDVSASMTERERKLAKTFFFLALQGIRRNYSTVETRFIGHTTHAWQFSEADFFSVSGTGGTGASSAFRLALELLQDEFPPDRFNAYMLYASDGENFSEDRAAATESLQRLTAQLNYIGYVETTPGTMHATDTEMKSICRELQRAGAPLAISVLVRKEDIWEAIRKFLVEQNQHEESLP
ncbi:uncharacterized sporulation protein YeaH/YhbH (DUF444 family) [Actimicrobium sp. GrIS 1.19]|uniref:DUF444 family protein n=1 Tax=Actimicrobium sp. GrIS 1.19 TaxID=3071708 RepID=UPI002E01EAC9|nr:uncharacterized sporulation protein YeaH/YhbH (DUF444 family) [Actimicrobium sp. GrIS 1.19]